ncbi:OmpA family protein [Phenylobacterium sp.]|uniref:OmpA family protein n=1 Tax=Phenylobacterium sp. TaxID=1871053 RepID=UPI002E349C68|nr:OmpA family protein [Phenylobacterium sp.]HEX2558892.1 OmpA family protein [Phenylobacterium sp.]
MKAYQLVAASALASIAMAGCAGFGGRDRLVKAPPRCEETAVQVYFDAGSHELTDESRTMLAQAASETAGCAVDRVVVMGLADAEGGPNANLELSKRRAQAVTAALAAVKLPAAEFRLAAAGEAGAVTAAGTEPLRRRVDVILQMRPAP